MNGEYRQLNDNVLQLENELYAPIRPKRTPCSGEALGCAGAARYRIHRAAHGWTSIPFTLPGIEVDQIRFFDLFLVWCLLRPSSVLRMTRLPATAATRTRWCWRGVAPA